MKATPSVYFDDLTVDHKSRVVQQLDYYPFGLEMAHSWEQLPNAVANPFRYNAGAEKNGQTGNYETLLRQYDPAMDPVAARYSSLSPYNYAFNDPVFWNDPSGADPNDWNYTSDYIDQNENDIIHRDHGPAYVEGHGSPAMAMLNGISNMMGGSSTYGQRFAMGGNYYAAGISTGVLSHDAFVQRTQQLAYESQLLNQAGNDDSNAAFELGKLWGDPGYITEIWMEWEVNGRPASATFHGYGIRSISSLDILGYDDYQSVVDEMIAANPELARFRGMAPHTEFKFDGIRATADPANGDKSVAGPAIVTIPKFVFTDRNLLYVVLGHELIHATHFESGSYARWYDSVLTQMEFYLQNISQRHMHIDGRYL